ncbi:MAG: tetratricopeptide repeat protein [Erysipelotrichaceae bacterium]|nr:tetratricopeptide repeat protein [Erysipelotrichaceae bacterium]
MKETNIDEIMVSIQEGLSSDAQTNIAWLRQQAKLYYNHPQSAEIILLIGHLLYQQFSDDEFEEIRKRYQTAFGLHEGLEKATELAKEGEFEKAVEILRSVAAQISDDKGKRIYFLHDQNNEYYSMSDPVEFYLFIVLNKTQKAIRQIDPDFFDLYYYLGVWLMELKQWEEAADCLQEALILNPVSAKTYFELCEVYKYQSRWDEFVYNTKKALSLCFNKKDLARCYRNLAYYFSVQKDWDHAYTMYQFSLVFDINTNAISELVYIEETAGIGRFFLDSEELSSKVLAMDIQFGANVEILQILMQLAKKLKKSGDYPTALIFYQQLYELMDNPDFLNEVNQLKQLIANPNVN